MGEAGGHRPTVSSLSNVAIHLYFPLSPLPFISFIPLP